MKVPLTKKKRGPRGGRPGNKNAVGNKGNTIEEKWPPKNYKPVFVEISAKLRDAGCTNDEVAEVLGVHVSMLYKWASKYPEFSRSLKVGGDIADDRVERSLFGNATGFYYTEEEVKVVDGEIHVVTVKKYKPPSDRAAQYWLNNRRRDKWKNRLPEDDDGQSVLIVKGGLPVGHPLRNKDGD